jgi:hypothetical protein
VRDTTPQVIWARPTFDAQGNVDRAGSNHLVQGWATWNEWAIQRSRRD